MATRSRRIFPGWLTNLQVKYMNPVLKPMAPYLPGFAQVRHRGRKSGREYTTIVNPVSIKKTLAIVLGHGPDTDWVRNILAAGEVDVQLRSGLRHYTNTRVIHKGHGDTDLPRVARLASRWLPVFVADRA